MSRSYGISNLMSGIIEDIEISHLNQPSNPVRLTIDRLEELANSIQKQGLLNPLIVRIKDSNTFEIVAGTRRYHACKMLGWRKLPCHVVNLDDKESFVASLIENVQRQSMNVLEEAMAYKRFVDNSGWGGITELATNLGKSISYVTKKIQLLDLPPAVLDSVKDSSLKPSIAEELCTVKDKGNQEMLAGIITKQHLSFRRSRTLVKSNELFTQYGKSEIEIRTEKIIKTLDKGITVLRVAMNRMSELIGNNEDNEVIVTKLMHHKNLLHEQIDDLIKEKKKASRVR
ncbi:MAG: ParB/RepB/Spo0J family partition protein [Thaumarchaeota archaeon]|nr:ParB/RepB/Spo0J family partition protein [Nitrososphaerota archaeon]